MGNNNTESWHLLLETYISLLGLQKYILKPKKHCNPITSLMFCAQETLEIDKHTIGSNLYPRTIILFVGTLMMNPLIFQKKKLFKLREIKLVSFMDINSCHGMMRRYWQQRQGKWEWTYWWVVTITKWSCQEKIILHCWIQDHWRDHLVL